MNPVVEAPRSQLHPNLVGADVARDLEDLRDRESLVAVVLGIVDLAVGYLEHRGNRELRARRGDAVLEGAGNGEGLKGRARLVVEADGAVLVGVRRGAGDVVGVNSGPVRKRQDGAGVRVHHDRRRSLRRVVGAHVRQYLLDLVLQRCVDRQRQVLSGASRAHVVDRDRLADCVVDDPANPIASPQRPVVAILDSAQPAVPPPDRAQHLRGGPGAGIDALRLRDQRDAIEVKLGDRCGLACG